MLKRYYADGVKILKQSETERTFAYNGTYIGTVETVSNWGTSYLARPFGYDAKENKYFPTLRAASDYLVEKSKGK